MDYINLKAGEIEPMLGKRIKEVILVSNTYIVYMDDSDVIQWATDHFVADEHFGEIANDISYWESICNRLFSKSEAYDFKTILAEGYARMLDNNDYNLARSIIDKTAIRITKQGREILRLKYLKASLITTSIIAGIIVL